MIINPYLKARLDPAWQRLRRWRLFSRSAVWLSLCALLGWLLFGSDRPVAPGHLRLWGACAVAGLALILALWHWTRPDYRALARRIESRHPSLDGQLSTAVELDSSVQPAFIQERLLQLTMQHGLDHDWKNHVKPLPLDAAQAFSLLAAGACAAIFLTALTPPASLAIPSLATSEDAVKLSGGVEVAPGDTEIEKGSNLLAMVRFTETVPATVELIRGQTPETEQRQFLVRSLQDPLFGGSVSDVQEGFRYRIDYDGQRTRDFTVKVFEFPKLERSDLTLTYPAWTQLPEKRTEDTRRATAVEGTKLRLDLQLNKPVASAILQPREKDGKAISLVTDPTKATAILADYTLAISGSYELILTDADRRVNKIPAVFSFEVLPNQPPVIKLTSPKGDQRPSALEEMGFAGTVSDDFGVHAWGMAFTHGGDPPTEIKLGKDGPALAPQSFQHWVRLEEMKAQPDDLISWVVWAEDTGPDGKIRRTHTDLFFGEVRPFEEIFRQGEEAAGGAPPPGEAPSGAAEQAAKLAELQKQIINATWKLQRAATVPEGDITLVRDSQNDALAQATEGAADASDDPRVLAGWKKAQEAMKLASKELDTARQKASPLTPALAAEQKAYQALLSVRARETQISRSQSQGPPGSAADQQRQMELDEMDLTKEENRYQMQSEAQAPQETAQREQRQVLNRLQELARRQEEVNEKLQELQTALQADRTEAERKELERELKRLEEEQRQMLADVDELNQRMEKPENQEQLAQEKKELENARKNIQDATKATAEGKVAQALSSGTRAQQQLQDMREELRKKSSSAFNEELRDLRSEARELASRQEKVTQQLEKIEAPQQRSLSETPSQETAQNELAEQQKRTQALTQKAAELSESAEAAEPLVSRQLYDSMRQFAQEDASSVKETQQKLLAEGRMTRQLMDELNEIQQGPDSGKALEMTSGLLNQDLLEDAQSGAEGVEKSINQFKAGIEQAAEKVLGDDTEALKRADRELDQLTKDLEKEIAAAGSLDTPPTEEGAAKNAPSEAAQASANGAPAGASPEGTATEAAGENPNPAEGQGTENGPPPPNEGKPEAGEPNPNSKGEGKGEGAGKGEGGNQDAQDGARGEGSSPSGSGPRLAGGRGGSAAPMTGDGYAPWSDRLREVEEMVDFPDLRNDIANARERAREMRVEMKRDLKKPDWAVVRAEVMTPLVEVRQRLREELAKRTSRESLVPIDRDPVPGRYTEQVRRYYEQLGKDQTP